MVSFVLLFAARDLGPTTLNNLGSLLIAHHIPWILSVNGLAFCWILVPHASVCDVKYEWNYFWVMWFDFWDITVWILMDVMCDVLTLFIRCQMWGCSTVNAAVSNQILQPSIIWRDWFWFRCFLVQWKWMLKFILLQNQFVEANIRPVITYGFLSFLLVFLQWWCVLESSVGCFLTSTISNQSY